MSSRSIFFDLETTDLSPVGQILNCCFTIVDENFNFISSLDRKVKISRLQLPRIGALLANRTVVKRHQEEADGSEVHVMRDVFQFLREETQNSKIPLIGYNSSRFDIDFLRTSLIRNGFNPYFNVVNKDLLHICRFLAATNEKFRTELGTSSSGELSLTLENICAKAGLLDGAQKHESSADVLLSISLAKFFLKEFGIDIRTFAAYEGLKFHGKYSSIVQRVEPNYKEPQKPLHSYWALIDSSHRYGLWVNLDRYVAVKEGGEDLRSAVQCLKVDGSDFFVQSIDEVSTELKEVASSALKDLKGLNLKNFFGPTSCDIEAFIYRIAPDEIDLLHKIIWRKSKDKPLSEDVKRIIGRFRLSTADICTDYVIKHLPEYAEYRYGGKMILSRSPSEEEAKKAIHPTLAELFSEIVEAKKTAASKEDLEIISSLESYYYESEIYAVAGEKLLKAKAKAA